VFTPSVVVGGLGGAHDTVVTLEVAPGVVVRFDRRAIGMRAGQQSGGAA
jgi:hypothetical protein